MSRYSDMVRDVDASRRPPKREGTFKVERWAPGWYDAKVLETDGDAQSQAGNDMLVIQLRVEDSEGREKQVRKHLVFHYANGSGPLKWDKDMLDLLPQIFGTTDEQAWVGKRCRVRLKKPKVEVNANGYENEDEVADFDVIDRDPDEEMVQKVRQRAEARQAREEQTRKEMEDAMDRARTDEDDDWRPPAGYYESQGKPLSTEEEPPF